MVGRGVERGSGQRESLPFIDFFRRWGQYHPKDRLALIIANVMAITTLIRDCRAGSDVAISPIPEIALLVVVPIGWSIHAAITMRREAIKRNHPSNLK